MSERKCKPSWLDSYLEYTDDQESPIAFHQWVGISLISSVLQRQIWIPRVKYTIYPNLFVILIAGSAKCRKSISIRIGMDLLHSITKPPTIFAQKITTEALIQALEESKTKEKTCYGIIVASELSVFLGADAIRSGIIPALTDLYDSPAKWEYHTRSRGKENLTNVTLSMLAASTKDWLKTSIPASAIGGGFTSRIVFVVADQPSKLVLFPTEHTDNTHLRESLIHDLNQMAKLNGAMQFTNEAKAVSLEWYEREACNVHDEKVDGYFGRKHDTMFKMATVLSLAENDELLIEARHITRALDMMEHNEQFLNTILESVTSTVVGGDTEKVLTIIRKFRQISHSDLLRKCWRYASAMELGEMMKTLTESNEIEMFLDKKNARWYKVKGKIV